MSLLRRYKALGESFNPNEIELRQSLRVNTLKISKKDLIKRLKKKNVKLEKIDFLDNGYYYEAKFSLGSTQEYLQGYYYLQEAASQLPVQVLNPVSGDLVLDMAAAPGSKSTQISQMMKNKGILVAVESNISRTKSLINNLERLSVTNVLVYKKDSRFIQDFNVEFDKILLDAPCSGNFCVEKDFFKKRTPHDFKIKANTQKELLKAAIKCLKKGGTLVYSTCSLEPEENELVIQWFIEKYPEMKLVDTGIKIGEPGLTEIFKKSLSKDIEKTRRFWPHKTGTEGFFIAKLKKND